MSYLIRNKRLVSIVVIVVLLICAGGYVLRNQWIPIARSIIPSFQNQHGRKEVSHSDHDGHDHDGHDHDGHDHDGHDHDGHDHDGHDRASDDHEGHDDATAIALSKNARKNVGLRTAKVRLQPFVRHVVIPAMVVERPGRSLIEVTAHFTGIVTLIHPIEGETVAPGDPLFELRLTHEDLVTAQRDFLRSIEELDVVEAEVERLASLTNVIEGKRLLEKKYEQKKIQAALHAQRQGLLLHSLTEDQIESIVTTRKLLQSLTIVAPSNTEEANTEDGQGRNKEHSYHVQSIRVRQGQHVSAGDTLSILADHWELYIEGKAFEEDAELLQEAIKQQLEIKAVFSSYDKQQDRPQGLKILYIADRVDPDSRALHFYLNLPNEIVRDTTKDGHRFIGWKYRPGQRMRLLVPVERWDNRIVLPIEAIVEEGAETYLFEQNGDHFDRVSVHVEYRDKDTVVIENNGSLVGSTVAISGAYQMHLALKNKAGSGVDPHAGHNH